MVADPDKFTSSSKKIARISLYVSVLYVCVSILGVYGTDRLLFYWLKTPQMWIFIAKAWLFVAVTGSLLYYFLMRQLMRAQLHAQEQAFQSQKSECLGRMATGVAHDFNNILQVVRAAASMGVESSTGRPELIVLFQAVDRASSQGKILVQNLMDFARHEPGKPQLVRAAAVADKMAELLKNLIRMPVKLRLDIAADAGWIELEPVQIEQVLLNLAINAIDAMPNGGTVTLGVFKRGAMVELSVSDTGTGIKPDVLPHIFEPFFTTKEGQGTGLGLATSLAIVKKWGGQIEVLSRPGEGSTFRVLVPATSAPKHLE
jgi:two-component system cell cycle sensor histidine kinase/response regulator CckA